MKHLAQCVLLVLLLLHLSCSKQAPPRFPNFTEADLRRELTNGIAKQDVIRLLGEPVTRMETSETGYVLRVRVADGRKSQQNDEFLGLEAFFENDRLTRWRAWKAGDPALPESR